MGDTRTKFIMYWSTTSLEMVPITNVRILSRRRLGPFIGRYLDKSKIQEAL